MAFAPGALYESSWDETAFMVRGSAGLDGRLPYSLVRGAASNTDWTIVRQANSSCVGIYPRGLLPEDLDRRAAAARCHPDAPVPSRG